MGCLVVVGYPERDRELLWIAIGVIKRSGNRDKKVNIRDRSKGRGRGCQEPLKILKWPNFFLVVTNGLKSKSANFF